ncbi:hypothetical protein B566_EDAN007056 [Ephemera danica]|nr:hypothetical protein B566_EDAN007056 [Ephemera danica]
MNEVVNIEWQFGVTAASSEASQIGLTYLHLKLVLRDPNSSKLTTVCLEMTLPQFYLFLHELEKAKANLDFTN